MKTAPLDLALRHISESRSLLAVLIASSESFDYPKAKEALRELERKVRELGKAQAELQMANRSGESNITLASFFRQGPERPKDNSSG